MPKTVSKLNANINVACDPQLRRKVKALSWVFGHEGRFSTLARALIREGVIREVKGLSEEKREQYEEVLKNLTAADHIKSQDIVENLTVLDKETMDDEPEGTEGPYDPTAE